jgi:hypothetical protein
MESIALVTLRLRVKWRYFANHQRSGGRYSNLKRRLEERWGCYAIYEASTPLHCDRFG